MKSVMIVDDESLVRIGLQSVLDWNRLGYEVIGAYRNGVEAWNAMLARCPDVLLTDIQMPEMDGLELIRRAKETYPRLHVIILSSYEDYDYMRRAIGLQVQDYIVKHRLEPDELIRVLDKLQYGPGATSPACPPEAAEKNRLLEQTRRVPGIAPTFAYDPRQYPQLHARIGAPGVRLSWLIFGAAPHDPAKPLEKEQRKGLAVLFEEVLTRRGKALFLGEDEAAFHALVLTEPAHGPSYSTDLSELHQELDANIQNIFAAGLASCAVGSVSAPAGLARLRADAERLLRQKMFMQGAGLYVNTSGVRFRPIADEEWFEYFKQLKLLLQEENYDGLFRMMIARVNALGEAAEPDELIRLCRIGASRCVDYLLERYSVHVLERGAGGEMLLGLLQTMDGIGDWNKLRGVLLLMNNEIVRFVGRIDASNGWVRTVQQFIETHYDRAIRLEDAAAQVNFSVNYISQRFHQATGISFSDYLTSVRIRKAIELFRETGESTEQIAMKVGYPNPNYFSKVFKKVTGLTLTEFRRKSGTS